ncbi:MAG TPA: ABC transporter substrate-binding protein [Streptosporangiaceae bacterium]
MTAAVAGVLLLAAGCRVPGFSSSGNEPSVTATLNVVATPGVESAPLYIGLKEGLFQQVGLTVNVKELPSVRSEVSALQDGHADIAFGDYADMFYAQEQTPAPHLVIVADGYDAQPNVMEVLTLPSNHIVAPSDLAGKRIGTPDPQEMPAVVPGQAGRPYSLETIATQSVLTNNNVDPASIQWDPMSTDSLITALSNHHVDAILATEPTIYEAESKLGAVPVLDSCTGQTANLPLAGYFTTSSFSTTHPAVVAAFRSALLQAQAHAAMAASVQEALTHYAQMKQQTAALVTLGTYPTSLNVANLQRVAQLMFFFNTIQTPVDVKSMVAR